MEYTLFFSIEVSKSMSKVYCFDCQHYPKSIFRKIFNIKPKFDFIATCESPKLKALKQLNELNHFQPQSEEVPGGFNSSYCAVLNSCNNCRFFESRHQNADI